MRNFTKRTCAYCGELFTPTSANQKYCTRDHYAVCPICQTRYLIHNKANLSKPPAGCSAKCSSILRRSTSLQKYNVDNPGNSNEARNKARNTMRNKYGSDYTMLCDELRNKQIQTTLDRYGVENIQQVKQVAQLSREHQKENWYHKIRQEFTFTPPKAITSPIFKIDETNMQVYILKEKASVTFLKAYGHRINPVFGKIHTSVGLVDDGILYQVLRFERKDEKIVLADFGTRGNYFNPNYYTKIMNVALNTIGIDEFTGAIPRTLATPELVNSLSVKLVNQGRYTPYWITENGLKKVTMRDDIPEMKKKYDYITSDYLDEYEYEEQPDRIKDPLDILIEQ